VTSKGIWSVGIAALGALAAFCIWQHAPTSTSTSQVPQIVSTTTPSVIAPKGVLPPVVTGPTADATIRMPSGEPATVTPKIEAPLTTPAVPPKVAPQVLPDVVAKPEPKVEVPKVEAPVAAIPNSPKVDTTPLVIAPKPAVAAKQILVKPKKKRAMLAKRSNAGCEYKRDSNVVRSICFNFNSDRLSASSKAKLNAILPTLKAGNQFELNGFADAVGNKTYNSNLSERRSKAVLKYLTSKGVDASKVSVKSFGSEEAEKQKPGKNQKERRVDVRVLP
jgi:outer membrane protein OmpA-like peptidoglycan-associated protein